MSNQKLVWMESTGGPLILLEDGLVPYWRGVSNTSESSVTDYERACAVTDYLGNVKVGAGRGVVLGEEPYSTTWWPSNHSPPGLLVRWVFAESEDEVTGALEVVSSNRWESSGVNLDVKSGHILLFDAACAGDEIDSYISIQMPHGSYVMETLHYAPSDELSLILHRFVLKLF